MQDDIYYKKCITFNFWKHSLKFKTSQDLFSSYSIDLGTQFLLRTLAESDVHPLNILDLGCGYGPLGLTLKSLHPESTLHMVDKDALAIDYSRQNAQLNGLSNVEVYGSLGYDEIKKSDFDLILSNIPGKAGEPVISYFLKEAAYHLVPDGLVAIVAVTPLEQSIFDTLKASPEINILFKKSRPGHTVFHYNFTDRPSNPKPEISALKRGIYTRKQKTFHTDGLDFLMHTAWGLPEFDSLDFRTEIIIKALKTIKGSGIQRVAVFNPGQGHIPVAIWQTFMPQRISLVDRDLLALRYTRLNLELNHCSPEVIQTSHQIGIELSEPEKIDLWAGVLKEEEGEKAMITTLQQAIKMLSDRGQLILCGSSTAITRLVNFINSQGLIGIKTRQKWRDNSLLILGNT